MCTVEEKKKARTNTDLKSTAWVRPPACWYCCTKWWGSNVISLDKRYNGWASHCPDRSLRLSTSCTISPDAKTAYKRMNKCIRMMLFIEAFENFSKMLSRLRLLLVNTPIDSTADPNLPIGTASGTCLRRWAWFMWLVKRSLHVILGVWSFCKHQIYRYGLLWFRTEGNIGH